MQFESGNLVPSIERLGFFPFSVSEDISGLYNISGFSGPIEYNGPTTPSRMFSGVLGNGTYYPASGNIEQLLRLFWGVKAWSMQISYSSLNTEIANCADFPITLTYEITSTIVKTLIIQDYWSYYNKTGEFTPLVDNGSGPFPNSNTCVPIDPIQKYEDLFCRKKYFTWMPDTGSISQFVRRTQGLFTGVRTPYSERFDIFRRASLETPCYSSTFSNVQSLFCLSIMNPDFLVFSGMNKETGRGYMQPTGLDKYNYNNFLGNQWESGDLQTNRWGEITGFGVESFKPSGEIPNLFYKEFIKDENNPDYIDGLNPSGENNYFPLIYFYMKAANNETVTSTFNFPVDEYVSTLYTRPNARRVGTFSIIDSNIPVNNTATGLSAKTMFSCPIWGSSLNPMLNINVRLLPTSFWLTSSGTINY